MQLYAVLLNPSAEAEDTTCRLSARLKNYYRRNKDTMKDPIIAEIRQIREAYAKRFNYDVHAMLRDLRARQIKSGRKTVSLPPKRIKPVEQTTDATTTANT